MYFGWCGLWSGGVNGPYFFSKMNGLRYRKIINEFFLPELDGVDPEIPRFIDEMIDLLSEMFYFFFLIPKDHLLLENPVHLFVENLFSKMSLHSQMVELFYERPKDVISILKLSKLNCSVIF